MVIAQEFKDFFKNPDGGSGPSVCTSVMSCGLVCLLLTLFQVLVETRGLDSQVGYLASFALVIATNFHSLIVALSGLGVEMFGRIFLLRLLRCTEGLHLR